VSVTWQEPRPVLWIEPRPVEWREPLPVMWVDQSIFPDAAPSVTNPIVTESGAYWVTESGAYIIWQ